MKMLMRLVNVCACRPISRVFGLTGASSTKTVSNDDTRSEARPGNLTDIRRPSPRSRRFRDSRNPVETLARCYADFDLAKHDLRVWYELDHSRQSLQILASTWLSVGIHELSNIHAGFQERLFESLAIMDTERYNLLRKKYQSFLPDFESPARDISLMRAGKCMEPWNLQSVLLPGWIGIILSPVAVLGAERARHGVIVRCV